MSEGSFTPEIHNTTSKEQSAKESSNPGKLAKTTIEAMWEISRRGLKPKIEDPEGHLQEARDHLSQGKPLIVFINHSTFVDTNEVGHVIEDHVTTLNNVGAIIAINQFDKQEGFVMPEGHIGKKLAANFARLVRKAQYWVIDNASRTKGFRLFPIIREKDQNLYGDRYKLPGPATGGLTPEQFNRESNEEALRFLREPGHVLMLAPEGGVNQDGNLTRAHDGLGDLLRIFRKKDAKAMGIALTPKAYIGGKARPTPLFTFEEATELQARIQGNLEEQPTDKDGNPTRVTIADALMTQLARNIPQEHQGYYAPMVKAISPQPQP
jgi:1-acyl-sn-glycerol-3-phosphate acyltransferase